MEQDTRLEDNLNIAGRRLPSRNIRPTPEVWNAPSYPGYGSPEQVVRSIRWWGIFRRHRSGVLAILFLCIAGSVLVTLLSPPVYRSRALLEVLAVNQDFMNNRDLDPNTASLAPDTYIETQTKLLMSETVAERVVKALLSSTAGNETDGGMPKLRRWLHLTPKEPESPESVVRSMLRGAKVKAEGQSSLITLTVDGPTPKLAAETANVLAEQDIAELQEARWGTAMKTGEFLSKQMEGMKERLQASEVQLQDYARKAGLVYTSDTSHESIAQDKLRELQQDLEKAEADNADKQSQMEAVQSNAQNTPPRTLDDASLRADKDKIADLRRQRAQLRTNFTPSHYRVKEVESQIEELQAEMTRERADIVKRVESNYWASARRQALLSKAYDRQVALVSQQSAMEVHYNMLKRESDANRDLYQSMLQKVKEASVVAALRASNIRIVDRAKPLSSPYQPNVVVNTGIGVLAGCMLSVLFVLFRERTDQSIRAPGECARVLDVPELATIPSGKRDVQVRFLSASAATKRRTLDLSKLARFKFWSPANSQNGHKWEISSGPKLLTAHQPCDPWGLGESLVAESFRSAVTSIVLWSRKKGGHRTIVVTSAHAKAGKTTTVLNIGLRLAESGHRVLLVDGDLRRPTLGPIFGFGGASGLSDILAEGFDTTPIKDFLKETASPGLSVLPGGAPRRNVAQLLHSIRLDKLLKQLRGEFDFVLIDSPPMIPMTDARLLGQRADGVILVCRAGQTSMDQLVSLRDSFHLDGTEVMGTILNDWDPRAEDPAYMRSYSRYYKTAGSTWMERTRT